MNKKEKYKFVFESAEKFLKESISKYLNLNADNVLKEFFEHEKFDNISGAMRRLIVSLQNRGMMPNVIQFENREKEFSQILFNYNPHKILRAYKNSDKLIGKFRKKFRPNSHGPTSLWYQFSKGIISGSKFMETFKDKKDFDDFIKTFAHNKYTKAALPMLLSKEIDGFGFPLACDFLKELGYRDYPKPDSMLKDIFHSYKRDGEYIYSLVLASSRSDYDVYKSIIEMSEVVGKDAYTVDKIFWLIGSGKFDPKDKNRRVGRIKIRYIEEVKASTNWQKS